MMADQKGILIKVRVSALCHEAEDILSCELMPVGDQALPVFFPGAHIDVHLPPDMIRQYSLVNETNGKSYKISVALDEKSRGGSRWMHESLSLEDELWISPPRNSFPLAETENHSVFFAGGIGVTPIYSMVSHLKKLERPWSLYYAARSEKNAAFTQDLRSLGSQCHFHFDDEHKGHLDIEETVKAAPEGSHFYCCGPVGMMAAFDAAVVDKAEKYIHSEVFQAGEVAEGESAFVVELSHSGKVINVGADETILDAILKSGGNVEWSCRNGVCGTCETDVLEGIPDHRDLILSDEEKASGETIMICCSRAKSAKLILDI